MGEPSSRTAIRRSSVAQGHRTASDSYGQFYATLLAQRPAADDLDRLQRISDLVAQGINIAGIAQTLHLERRNTALESDNSHLQSENARLRSEEPSTTRRTERR